MFMFFIIARRYASTVTVFWPYDCYKVSVRSVRVVLEEIMFPHPCLAAQAPTILHPPKA